jgi:hypothetical protein
MLVYYEMTTVTMMVMRRKRLKTPKNMNFQNMQLFVSNMESKHYSKKYGCMYEQFQLSMCLFK